MVNLKRVYFYSLITSRVPSKSLQNISVDFAVVIRDTEIASMIQSMTTEAKTTHKPAL